MDEVCLIILEVFIAHCAIVMFWGGLFVAFEKRLRFESSIALRKGARNELGGSCGRHDADNEAPCNRRRSGRILITCRGVGL